MTKDEALRMALEALEADELDMVDDGSGNMVFRKEQAITAIKKALAQPEHDNIYGYASSLATAIWHKHYIKESPKFALLDTTEGVLTQIDNMTCGLVREKPAQPEQTNTRPYYTIDELNAWADEKEKQAWRNAAIRIGEELSSVGPDGYYDMNAWQWLDWAMENVKKAQPEQEPVAWGVFEGNLHDMFFSPSEAQEMADLKGTHAEVRPLYTTPPQRKPQYDKTEMNCFVQDLYDKKIQEGKHGQYEAMFHVVHRAIEAAHGIKE